MCAEEIRQLYKEHEIAAHGQYHGCMVGRDVGRCVAEILESRKMLEELLHRPITGYAYAFGAYDETVLKAVEASGIGYARTIESTNLFDIRKIFFGGIQPAITMMKNFLIWQSSFCQMNYIFRY